MMYRDMLSLQPCNNCRRKRDCFLRNMPLRSYPEATQNFVIHLPASIFDLHNTDRRWHADYHRIESQLIAYYDLYNCFIPQNVQVPLSKEAQENSDRQYIRDTFKNLLDAAAKATEDANPAASILFDGIGLVLASDYLEAVHKVFSMFRTYSKAVHSYDRDCPQYSAGF